MNIVTTHSLARELLSKPDGFITTSVDEEEYVIEGIKRKATLANWDDTSLYWTLICHKSNRSALR